LEYRFIAKRLRALDLAQAELLACCMWSDVRPVQGVAGLVDYRMAGRLSGLSRESFALGVLGEVVCMPGKPKLPFDKVLVFGLGPKAEFTESVYERAVRHISETLERLRVARAVVELPGRADESLPPERAATLLVSSVPGDVHDAWWLAEDAAAQKKMADRLQHERRGVRRA
jgi:Cytosol aminopeptidase family, N-terminal domain